MRGRRRFLALLAVGLIGAAVGGAVLLRRFVAGAAPDGRGPLRQGCGRGHDHHPGDDGAFRARRAALRRAAVGDHPGSDDRAPGTGGLPGVRHRGDRRPGRPAQPRRRRHREPRRRRSAAHRPRTGRHGRPAGDLRRDHRPPHGRRPVGARPPARHQLRRALAPHAREHGLAADGPRAGPAPVEGEPRRQRPRARRAPTPGSSWPRAATPTTAPRRSTSPSRPSTPFRGQSCRSTWPPSATGPTTSRPSTIPPVPGRPTPAIRSVGPAARTRPACSGTAP